MNDLKILRTRSEEANLLTKVAAESKAYWPYPIDYLEKFEHAVAMTPDYIENWPVFNAVIEERIIGFFSLKVIKGEKRLDNLWIIPEFIGRGLGTLLFARAIEEAKNLGWNSFRLAADPYAMKFYEKLGATQIGVVQSKIKPDLFLPHLEFIF